MLASAAMRADDEGAARRPNCHRHTSAARRKQTRRHFFVAARSALRAARNVSQAALALSVNFGRFDWWPGRRVIACQAMPLRSSPATTHLAGRRHAFAR